jgi:phosphoenolpyruvate-protein kinase (PTS system EI component)
MIADVIATAHACGRKIGICGQAPSDYPEFARFLVEHGIDSISLNPDAIVRGLETIAAAEQRSSAGAPAAPVDETTAETTASHRARDLSAGRAGGAFPLAGQRDCA